jgi:hypothetical protein
MEGKAAIRFHVDGRHADHSVGDRSEAGDLGLQVIGGGIGSEERECEQKKRSQFHTGQWELVYVDTDRTDCDHLVGLPEGIFSGSLLEEASEYRD